jgi:AcrR family transcriptional regulator
MAVRRNGLKAQEKILRAADKLFGESGYDAVSTREIAELAGVNKALIHYHFKSKEDLLAAVLDDYYERANQALMAALAAPGAPRDMMRRVIDAYCDFLAHNRSFSRIVQREGAGGPHEGLIRKRLQGMFTAGITAVQAAWPASRSGDMAAHHLLVSFYGMIVSYFTYSDLLKHLTGVNPLSRQQLAQRKQHLYRMVDIVAMDLETTG